MNTRAKFATEGTYSPDNLIAGCADDLIARKIIVVSGQNLVRGAVIGKITASGKYALSLSTATDGSEVPDLILAETTDASGADASALAYSRGDFTTQALTIGASHTAASITEGLRTKGIVLLSAIA